MHDRPKYDSPFTDALKLERVLDKSNSAPSIVPEQLYLIEEENLLLMNSMLEEMKECSSIDQMERVIQKKTDELTQQIKKYDDCLVLLKDRPYSQQVIQAQLDGLIDQRALYFNIREDILNLIIKHDNTNPIIFLENVQSIVKDREQQFASSAYALSRKNYELN